MKHISLLIAALFAAVAFGAEDDAATTPDIDIIDFNYDDAHHLSRVYAMGDGQQLFRHDTQTETSKGLGIANVVQMYDAFHLRNAVIRYSDDMAARIYRRTDIHEMEDSHFHLDFIRNPVFLGTTSIERLGQVIEYVRGGAGERAALLAARAGDMSLLKTWSAWLTYNAVLGLSHSNRSDTIKWALIEQNMTYSMDTHFSQGNIAKWNEAYSALDTATGFYIAENLTRTALGLTATDDLPTRIKGPRLVRASTTNPVATAAYRDEALTLVIDGELPYLDASMRGPSAP